MSIKAMPDYAATPIVLTRLVLTSLQQLAHCYASLPNTTSWMADNIPATTATREYLCDNHYIHNIILVF